MSTGPAQKQPIRRSLRKSTVSKDNKDANDNDESMKKVNIYSKRKKKFVLLGSFIFSLQNDNNYTFAVFQAVYFLYDLTNLMCFFLRQTMNGKISNAKDKKSRAMTDQKEVRILGATEVNGEKKFGPMDQ